MRTVVRVMALVLLTSFLGCGQGWSVGGVVLTPQDTVQNTVFIELMGADSVIHYYHGRVYTRSNWCWLHHQFEDVEHE
tara:strand:+ start:1553 stop:1786 length:234 start_codon:yes stop_codon:yes gene_type:complete